MKVLKENMEELLTEADYLKRKEYEDKELNDSFNYWVFFEEKEKIIQTLTNESIESILYSKYYWSSRYKERYMEIYGSDASVEQQQYKILEEIDQRINEDVDWNIIQLIEEDNV